MERSLQRAFRSWVKLICFPNLVVLKIQPQTNNIGITWEHVIQILSPSPDLLNQKLWSFVGWGYRERADPGSDIQLLSLLPLTTSTSITYHCLIGPLTHSCPWFAQIQIPQLLDYSYQGIALNIHSTARTPSAPPTVHRAKAKPLGKAIRWSLWPRGSVPSLFIPWDSQPRYCCWIHCAHLAEFIQMQWSIISFSNMTSSMKPHSLKLFIYFCISDSPSHVYYTDLHGKPDQVSSPFPRPLKSCPFIIDGQHQV